MNNNDPENRHHRNYGRFIPWHTKHDESPRNLAIHIQRVSDGEVHIIKEDERGGNWGYSWSEGNYSCDCNRRRYFEGDNYDDTVDYDCTSTDFLVRIYDSTTNELLYDEWENS